MANPNYIYPIEERVSAIGIQYVFVSKGEKYDAVFVANKFVHL